MKQLAMALLALGMSLHAFAVDRLIELETRPGITVPVFYMKQASAKATVILLPGGAGGLGQINEGKPGSKNFLVRSREYFAEAGLNVAVMGRASDKDDLDYADRIAKDHIEDVSKLVTFLKKDSGLPIWLIGTSRGTVSATAAAIDFGNGRLAGIVLTSSVVNHKKTGAIPSQNLAAIRIPVLVLHHEKDSCKVCSPHEVPAILRGLTNTPVSKLIFVQEGQDPQGDSCEALHYHGFIGAEKMTVKLISDWIKNPVP